MKFGQLVEYNMTYIFLKKPYTKCGAQAYPRSFYKKSKLSISPDQQSKIIQSLFQLYVQVVVYQNILKQGPDHLFLPHINFFLQKAYIIFCMILKKQFLTLYFVNYYYFV